MVSDTDWGEDYRRHRHGLDNELMVSEKRHGWVGKRVMGTSWSERERIRESVAERRVGGDGWKLGERRSTSKHETRSNKEKSPGRICIPERRENVQGTCTIHMHKRSRQSRGPSTGKGALSEEVLRG